MILAGDIGGTKTVLALFRPADGTLEPIREQRFASAEHASLEQIVERFLAGERGTIDVVCCGVAGAVVGGQAKITNLPWTIEEGSLARAAGATRAKLVNDLQAAALGAIHLPADRLAVLNEGATGRPPGDVAVVAAGTGLGEAILHWDGVHHHPLASEGGHKSFAPRGERQIELLRWLERRFGGHASFERILSGPGLVNVFEFLRESGFAPEPDWLSLRLLQGDDAATISEIGLTAEEPLTAEALSIFVSVYGAEAGNLALTCVAREVLLTGGIAPKILPALQRGGFVDAFTDKGRFRPLLQGVRVSVALEPRAPLLGAARFALRLLG